MMRRAMALVALGVGLVGLMTGPVAAESRRVRPTASGGEVKVLIGSKVSTYHAATQSDPVTFEITGPTRLRILSRVLFGDSPAGEVPLPYVLQVEIEDLEGRVIEEEAGVSEQAAELEGGAVGTLERSTLPIPAGRFTVRVFPVGEETMVGLRLFRDAPTRSPVKWVRFAPDSFEVAVRLHVGDDETTYYRFNGGKSVVVNIRGPLRLRVRTRVDFGPESGPSQSYVIKVALDGEAWKTFALKSKASHTAIYPDQPEITPGKGRDLEFTVPEGLHRVRFNLDCTTSSGATLRILVPEKGLQADLR